MRGFAGMHGAIGGDGCGAADARRLVAAITGGKRPVVVDELCVGGEKITLDTVDGDRKLLALNGRLDNADDLRAELGLPSGEAADERVALAAFRKWGEDAPSRLRGSYSAIFWDNARRRLILACDPLGRHPLYYARIGDALAFATGFRPLLALPGLPRDIDDDYFAAFLCDIQAEPEATFYAAIQRIPAACVAVWSPGESMRLREYWRPDWSRRIRHRQDETYVEEARALLDQAVRRQLRGLDTVVCHMSGGLDSTAVAATAARLRSPGVVHALTMAPAPGVPVAAHPSIFSDESEHAEAVARLYPNMEWRSLSSASLHPLDDDPARLFLTAGMPMRNGLNIGWFAPARDHTRALGARAALMGALGNLTLTWDGWPGLPGMLRRGEWGRLWREAAALGAAEGLSPWTVLRRHAVRPLLPPRVQAWIDERRGLVRSETGKYSPINPDFAHAVAIRERRLEIGVGYPSDSTGIRRRWLRRHQYGPAITAALCDVHGIEIRDPMADIDLLEYCFAVPDEQYVRGGTTRWLARRVFADRLPSKVLNETRRGYQCGDFFHRLTLQRDRIVEGVEALERSPLASRFLDIPRFKRILANWPSDPAAASAADLKIVLHRGYHIGRFLRWFEGGNQ